MRKYAVLVLFGFFVLSISGQSGRRITSKAKPITTTGKVVDYSESRSYKPRKIYPPNYKRRNRANSKAKPANTAISEGADEGTIKVDSSIVTIPVSVYDKNGLYIPNITQDEIKVFEDGKEQEIAYFGVSEKPFTVALLIDTSPSTEYRIEEIRAAAKAFVALLKPQDKVLVMEFDGDPQVLTKPTTNRHKIYRGIDKADFGGGTALYDAVGEVINKSLRKITGRKAVVLFTDGVDTVSHKYNYDSTLDDAEEADTIVFPIYYNTFYQNRRGGIFTSRNPQTGGRLMRQGTSEQEYALGKKYLDELAAYTGGRIFEPEKTVGGLMRAFENLAEELRRQYNLAYYPSKEGKLGQRKKIKVRVYRPRLVVRARDSYIVGANRKSKRE